MSVLKVTTENFEEEVLKSDKTVIIDFYADWCGPCKVMSPVIDEIEKELGDKVKVGKINSEENFEIAEKYGIMNIPTIMIVKNGTVQKSFIGVTDKKVILEAID